MPKSTKTIGLSELRVGLLVFIALAVLVVLILNASGELNPFKSHLHLRARFADANGLREGSDVKLAGVKIGKVDHLRLLSPSEVGTGPNPQKIEVFLTIDTKIDGIPATDRIRTDSQAQQASPSILGSEMIVNITPAHPWANPSLRISCCRPRLAAR
jgi:phospholipid/cholesterol/gamma-HCH transport system substrate-binding protein